MFISPQQIFSINSRNDFEALCIKVFNFQYLNNPIYHEYCNLILKKPVSEIDSLYEIPFLPIRFFKNKEVYAATTKPELIFTSSATTSQTPSKHLVAKKEIYVQSFLKSFYQFYGNINEYCILALLPSYLERTGSSLIYMIEELIKQSNDVDSGFFLYNHNELYNVIEKKDKTKKVLLFGVTFALLDFAEKFSLNLSNTIIMETGGMKGRKEEQTREEVHYQLTKALGTSQIHSEYGMTELLSQAYSKANGIFNTPPWMEILIRDNTDPLSYMPDNKSGAINVIDLANSYSCSFIATDDLGKKNNSGFEVLGRIDNSEIRGCNLMVI